MSDELGNAMMLRHEAEIARLNGYIAGLKIRYDIPWDEDDLQNARCTLNDFRRQSLGARPQEPGLSKEWLESLVDGPKSCIDYADYRDTPGAYSFAKAGARTLVDAILSSPSGPLSDPEDDLISREETIVAVLSVLNEKPYTDVIEEIRKVPSRGPLSDEPRAKETNEVAASSVGELEWRITDDEIYESEYWRIEGDGTRWLLLAWDGNEGVVMQTTDTLAAAKSLANSLRAPYARLLMSNEPRLAGVFETRRSRHDAVG